MITLDDGYKNKFCSDKSGAFPTTNVQYTNLNLNTLNQTVKAANISSSSFKSNRKPYDFDNDRFRNNLTSNSEALEKLSSNFSTSLSFNAKKNFNKTAQTKPSNTGSTLSLHIEAYEKGSTATERLPYHKKINVSSPMKFSAIFEFPRQQQNQIMESEIMQFHSAQQLLNNNATLNPPVQQINDPRAPRKKKRKVKASSSTSSKNLRRSILHVPDNTYSSDENFDDDNSSVTSAVSGDSRNSRRSTRTRRTPQSHHDYVRTDKKSRKSARTVQFNLTRQQSEDDIEQRLREQNEQYNFDEDDFMPCRDDEEDSLNSALEAASSDDESVAEDGGRTAAEGTGETDDESTGDTGDGTSAARKSKRGRKKKASSAAAPSRRDILNPPDLYFIARCDKCVFAANNLDVVAGTVMVNSTISLPVYGQAMVIYDQIENESVAEEEAKQYAKGMGLKYGKANGRFITWISSAPERVLDPNEDRIHLLEQENRELRLGQRTLKAQLENLERDFLAFREEVLNGRFSTSQQAPPLNEVIVDFRSPPCTPSTPTTSQRRVVATEEIEGAPTWAFMTELAAIELRTSNPDPKTFIRSVYVNLFSDLQTFQPALPAEIKKEFTKICTLMLDQSDASTTDLMKKEIDYQKIKVRARITAPKTALVAMVSTTPIPVVQQGDLWQPIDSTVTYQRMHGSNVRQWPVIIKDGQPCDTMYAARKDPENTRSFWKYFIVTRDGAYINCSKD